MRRFRWPLQRLLDVTVQREKALRAEVLGLSRESARLRGEILRRRSELRTAAAELDNRPLAERLVRQEVVMRCADGMQREISAMNVRIAQLEQVRKERTARLMEMRNKRKTLERLHEEARQGHIREQLKLEQKQFDETAAVAYARRQVLERAIAS